MLFPALYSAMDWPFTLKRVLEQQPCVLVTLNLILGSAPRESGSRMIVTGNAAYGSIGGGNLEYMATHKARQMLQHSTQPRQIHEPFGLGPALKQCCGGAVTLHFEVCSGGCPPWVAELAAGLEQQSPLLLLMAIDRAEPVRWVMRHDDSPPPAIPHPVWKAVGELLRGCAVGEEEGKGRGVAGICAVEVDGETWWLERINPNLQPLVLFGAGHVGQEVARLLERLPFAVTWVDSRAGVLPDPSAAHIRTVYTDDPVAEVAGAAPGTIFVVMTHSHELDENICFEILRRGDFCWLGLIGSATKRRRFVQRLNKRGINEQSLARLVCPIGLIGLAGKQPATIALSLAAQLMMEQPWTRANN
ncbi:MAG TPA: xanthine dehydrogenase accessory protein XdhC [Xanthomonadales bacterium]|nr:xanthine dehydrogenase accessory protein XdhC [Xanthomonadales bacterium]